MNENKKGKAPLLRNPLFVIAAAVAAVAILFGIILGVFSCVASLNAVVEYGGARIDKKAAAYLVSRYKNTYMQGLGINAEDTEEFWQEKTPEGISYGEDFEKSAEEFLRTVAVGAYIFDTHASLSSSTERAIEESAKNALELYYENTHHTRDYEELFKADAALYGYDFASFVEGEKLLYKYEMSRAALFGSDGSGVGVYSGDCAEYLDLAYTHVEIAFIRTQTTFDVSEESGERIKNADGSYKKRALTDEEKAQRASDVLDIMALIDAYNAGDAQTGISPSVINSAATRYKTDQAEDRIEKGYYISKSSDYYKSVSDWSAELKGAFDAALALTLDSSGNAYAYKELTLSNGNTDERVYCLMYKSRAASGAYADTDLSEFFSDFYADASVYAHAKLVGELTEKVTVKDAFYDMNVALIPHNDKHKVNEIKG